MHKDELVNQNKACQSNGKLLAQAGRVARPGYKLIEIPEDSFPIVLKVGKGCTVEFIDKQTHDKDGKLTESQELRTGKDGNTYWYDRLAKRRVDSPE